ncbi:MAG: hypothetical protein AB1831_07210 [Pseudomonadota bacterium]
MDKRARRPRVLVILLVALALLSGCVTTPPAPALPPGPVAVVPARHPPQADFNVYALGKGAAAGELGGQGAATGAAAGALLPVEMGPIGIAAYPIIAPFTILAGIVVGGTIGASYGAMHGLPADQAAQVRALVDQAVNRIGVHEQVASRVVARAQALGVPASLEAQGGPGSGAEKLDYAALRPAYRGVLELAVEKLGMAARKGDPPRIALEMKLRARVVPLGEGGIAGEQQLAWSGKPHPLGAWRTGGADMLAAEFEQGYDTLAQYVWETVVAPCGAGQAKAGCAPK